MEVRLSFKQLRETLETRLQRVDLYRDLPRGRKRPNWRAEFLNTLKEASQDIGDRRKAVGTMATAVVSGRHRLLGAQVERLAGGQKVVLRLGDPHPIAVDDCHRRGLGRARRDVDDQPEQPSLLDQRQHLAEVIVVPGPDQRPGGIQDLPSLLRKADQIASQTVCQQQAQSPRALEWCRIGDVVRLSCYH